MEGNGIADHGQAADVGFFQVEEVLMQKILSSPAKELVELYAGIIGQDEFKRYL